MRSYMDFVEEVFLSAAGWSPHVSYTDVILSSRNVLDFQVPSGTSMHMTGQASPAAVTSFTLSNLGGVGGSISYLYSSIPLKIPRTSEVPLGQLVQCYRHPLEAPALTQAVHTGAINENVAITSLSGGLRHNSLLYGRMFFPGQALEAMAIQQLSKSSHITSQWVCDPRMINAMVFTTTYKSAGPRWSREFIYSSHENLLGLRALGTVGSWSDGTSQSQLAVGGEAFFATSKKSPGLSVAARYASFSKYTSTPLTLTMVSNPLMGSISVSYALKPTAYAALSSRFDFNFYSYLSDLTVGGELWRTEPVSSHAKEQNADSEGRVMSVFKASTSLATQTARVLWETSYRGFLFSFGGTVCYGDRTLPVTWGIELSYAGTDVSHA